MAFFSLLWKARTIEKYRQEYENEKIKSILSSDTELPKKNFMQKCRHFHYDTKKQMEKKFRQWCPEGSAVSNFLIYARMDQTFPNFLLKSLLGFVGGIILTYLCFMFFVFQLSISLMHATIMSSVIGILLTLGLAFSYRIRCLVFLLIPQFFSRVGRYTLTCYALVLILTGPATNTLKNSEVLSESMACGQEQIKASVRQLNDSYKNALNLVKDSITAMVEKIKEISARFYEMLLRLNRLILSLVSILQSMYSWLLSLVPICNEQFGSPYKKCAQAIAKGYSQLNSTRLGSQLTYEDKDLIELVCWTVKHYDAICIPQDYVNRNIAMVVKRKLNTFSDKIKTMLYVDVHVHHTYSYNNNVSRTASQAAAGIVTEIRNRADPMLTWLSWSSCVTSLFLLLIIFRAKYYQQMYETRSRFDNRYLTKELRELDFKRQKQGKPTILPLNRRERMKYICTTSFELVPSEKVYLSRSAVFMTITTFKLLIHIVADYSLYWILMTIRHHGRFQTPMTPGYAESGVRITGTGPVARFMQAIFQAMHIPLNIPSPMPVACLPDPIPPDMHRYTQIGVLIFLLWFFALFEPYGLRLRHVIMGMYNPERAKARAAWLYNHILTTRAGFMKCARRKLHRQYKYSSETKLTFKCWLNSFLPFRWLQALFGTGPDKQRCLLCSTKEISKDPDTELIYCDSKACPGVFCISCFGDIGQLCTICLSPADYGDLSDISLELGSSDDSDNYDSFDDDDDDDSSDEKKCLLRQPLLKRKLSRTSTSTSKPTHIYEMRDLSYKKKVDNNEGTQETNLNKPSGLYMFYVDIQFNIHSARKVDYNNNVLKCFTPQKQNNERNKNLYDYLDFSVGLNTNNFITFKSISLVFMSTQGRNSSPQFFKFGCCHEIKIKKRQPLNSNKRSRESIDINYSSIMKLLKISKALLKNMHLSYYCLKKGKKGIICRKISNKTQTRSFKRKSSCIKIVKKKDSYFENYFKSLRALKVVSKFKRIKNTRVIKTHKEVYNNMVNVDMPLVQDSFKVKAVSNSDSLMEKCERGFEETVISNWINKDSEDRNFVLDNIKIKKEKSVTWQPISVYDVADESFQNDTSSMKKSSQATQIPSDYESQFLKGESSNLPSNSKSSRSRDREKKIKTCTCATQYRVPRKRENVVQKERRDLSSERQTARHHKRRQSPNCERHKKRNHSILRADKHKSNEHDKEKKSNHRKTTAHENNDDGDKEVVMGIAENNLCRRKNMKKISLPRKI